MAASSWSSRCPAGGNGRPKAACSRSHQPAPRPQNARPPLSASSVATVLASSPGARKVTGLTRVPSRIRLVTPASKPSVTHGSGMSSQARPTWGIWIRWSISAIPSRPASAAAAAMLRSHSAGSSAQANREICRTKPSRAGAARCCAAAAALPVVWAGSTARSSACRTTAHPSAAICRAVSAILPSCPSSTAAGTGTGLARFRRRHVAGSVSNSTATAGIPACLARSRCASRRAESMPSVSTTVVRPRPSRAATIWSSTLNASCEASRSCSPLPTMPRSRSDETISDDRYRSAAQADLPEPDGPTSTTSAGSGTVTAPLPSLIAPVMPAG
jgi:hypothetical protein